MSLSPVDLRRCTEAAGRLLEALELPAFQFAVEPGEEVWTLEVECRAPEGWTTREVPFDPAALEATLVDDAAFERMLARFRDALGFTPPPRPPARSPPAAPI